MRKRKDIEQDGKRTDLLILEVLLDIKDLLANQKPKQKRTRKPTTK
ncbi:MAG: hypothetical protein WC657_09370 [Candidatus Paceibacterota bacterium]|jgi:hypothetical protein